MNSSATPTSPDSFQTFGDLLKFLRRRERLTQLELSIAVGYSEAQISRLEKNQRSPDLAAVQALFIPALHLEDQPDFSVRLLKLAETARQEAAPAPGFPPYRGLLYFDESDSDLFFGREALTAQLASHVIDLAVDSSTRFLAVVGASGSGKSSLVRAGLAVDLRRMGWETHVFTPTANPLITFKAKLIPGPLGSGKQLLILVDQFEEVFTLCHDEGERTGFISELLAAAQDRSNKTSVVIALRADFYAHCAQYPLLRQAVAAEQEYIGQMTFEELRRTIEEPARQGNWQFEPGLVDVLLNDIGAQGAGEPEPGALPLLSHALLATWELRHGRMLTLDGYHASGGVRGAIAETAENVFTDQLDRTQQEIARDVFMRLTSLGEGTEDTRRRAGLKELVLQSGEATQVRSVLDTLAEARLITINEDNAEVAHEALIREWQRLHEWLTEDREGLLLHRHLTESALEWETRGRDPSDLYRGARLAQVREWVAANEGRLNAPERVFLDASIEQEQQEANEQEARRQRELETMRQLAESEKARAEQQASTAGQLRKRAYYLAGVLALAALAALVAGVLAVRSNASFTLSEAQRLAAEANNLFQLGADPQLNALLGIQSIKTRRTLEGDTALTSASTLAIPLKTFIMLNNSVLSAAISPDEKTLLTVGYDSVQLWDLQTGQEIRQFSTSYEPQRALFSPDGQSILIAGGDGVQLADITSGQVLQRFTGHEEPVVAIAFSPDGRYVLDGSADSTAILWDVETGEAIHTFRGHLEGILAVAYSPDGKSIVTVSAEGIILWQVDTGSPVRSFQGHTNGVTSVAFSPLGTTIVTGSRDRTARIWDVKSGEEVQRFTSQGQAIDSVAFSPDGRTLLTGGSDKTMRLWDVQTGRERQQFSGQVDSISVVGFSPVGRYLFSGSTDGSTWLWDSGQAGGEHPVFVQDNAFSSIDISPDGKLLVTGRPDSRISLWDAQSGRETGVFTGHNGWILSLHFSPDGQTFLSGSADGTARLWDVQTGRLLQVFEGQEDGSGPVTAVFSPDGKSVLTARNDGSVRLWDSASGELRTGFQANQGEINGIGILPDGQSVLTAGQDNIVRMWDLETGKLVREFPGHTDAVGGVAISPDGKYALSYSFDQTIRLWDIQTGEEIRQLATNNGIIQDVAFSPTGEVILTAGGDNTARLWDTNTGQELRRFTGHTASVEGVAFAKDGSFFATASEDGTARLWDVDYQDTIRYFCAHLIRDFTDAEREQYNITDRTPTCQGF